MPGKIMTALTKIEAETLWSRGRLQDALKLYQSLLDSSSNMTPSTKENIESRVKLLQEELERPPSEDGGREIDAAINKLQKAMSADQSVTELRESVKSYLKKELYTDALENLRELVRQNAADEFCVKATAECITKLYPLDDIPVAVDLFLTESFQHAKKAALFKMMLAEKMDQKGYSKQSKVLQHHDDRFKSYNQ